MIASAECPVTTIRMTPLMANCGQEARALATACLRYESACWRGDSARVFATRFGSYWRPVLPPVPSAEPDAYSPHGAGGRGIEWYEIGDEVFGYIRGASRGYRIPVAAVGGLVGCLPEGPCKIRDSSAAGTASHAILPFRSLTPPQVTH